MIKKSLSLALCTALLGICLSGCVVINFSPSQSVMGEGNLESFRYEVGEITDVRVEIFCDINFYSGQSGSVTLEMQPNLAEYITVEESGGVLTVRARSNIAMSYKTPILSISAPSLKSLSFSGAGTFTAYDKITADAFSLTMDGAGRGKAEFDVGSIDVAMSGAGNLELSGKADTAGFKMSGAGKLDALAMQTRDATVNMSGVGTVSLSCSDTLRINADGLGTVQYRGSPAIQQTNDGLVSIKKVD